MDPQTPPGCCPCTCSHCGRLQSPEWRRSMKRRLDQTDGPGPSPLAEVAARVEVENEVAALRDAVSSQQETIQELCAELEEERSAAASAASETMSMILRLQREKAEVQMEARQFKRFAEEKMAHDQREIVALEDLVFRKDEAIQALSYEVQAYKHRLVSLGFAADGPLADVEAPDSLVGGYDFDYPQLRCFVPADADPNDEGADPEKYAFGETPRGLERRIYDLENMPGSADVMEKEVVGEASNQHFRKASGGSSASVSGTSSVSVHNSGILGSMKGEEPPVTTVEHEPDVDDMSDRVYTIDAVHVPVSACKAEEEEEYGGTPKKVEGKGREMGGGGGAEEADMQKLYMRLQALEADRESMRQAIISMRTEKAQLVLLREIAQHLCKEAMPERRVVKEQQPLIKKFSIMSFLKWIMSSILWRKKAVQSKYAIGHSNSNVGLLLLLDKSPLMRQWSATSIPR